jgi:hypothetical protein
MICFHFLQNNIPEHLFYNYTTKITINNNETTINNNENTINNNTNTFPTMNTLSNITINNSIIDDSNSDTDIEMNDDDNNQDLDQDDITITKNNTITTTTTTNTTICDTNNNIKTTTTTNTTTNTNDTTTILLYHDYITIYYPLHTIPIEKQNYFLHLFTSNNKIRENVFSEYYDLFQCGMKEKDIRILLGERYIQLLEKFIHYNKENNISNIHYKVYIKCSIYTLYIENFTSISERWENIAERLLVKHENMNNMNVYQKFSDYIKDNQFLFIHYSIDIKEVEYQSKLNNSCWDYNIHKEYKNLDFHKVLLLGKKLHIIK